MDEILTILTKHITVITAISGLISGLVAVAIAFYAQRNKGKELDLKTLQAKEEHKHQISKEKAQSLHAERIDVHKKIFTLITSYQNDLYREGLYDDVDYDENGKPYVIERTKEDIYFSYIPNILQLIEKNYFLFSPKVVEFYESISDQYNKHKAGFEFYLEQEATDVANMKKESKEQKKYFLESTILDFNKLTNYIKKDIDEMKKVYIY